MDLGRYLYEQILKATQRGDNEAQSPSEFAPVATEHLQSIAKGADSLGNLAIGMPFSQAVKNAISNIQNPKQILDRKLNPEEIAMMGLFGGAGGKGFAKANAEGKTFGNLADKMMRYEIDDSGAKLLAIESSPKSYKLKDVISHKEFFNHYPELKNTNVFIDPRGKNHYEPKSDTIHLASSYFDKSYEYNPNMKDNGLGVIGERMNNGKSSLLHEIQHAIQEKEGFARGGSPTLFIESEKNIPEVIDRINKLKSDIEYNRTSTKYKKYFDSFKNKEKVDKFYEDGIIEKKQAEIDKLNNYKERTYSFDKYKRLAGEIEARDVSARMNLTPGQRANTAPYSSENIPLMDWIIRGIQGQ